MSTYIVEGMTCDHCVLSVTEEVAEVDGVDDARADLASGRLTVVGNGYSDRAIAAAVEEAGYQVAA